MDGLVSNVSLVAGVAGAGASHTFVVLTGLAGLVAGACSMAAGEYISVQSQNELIGAEVENERRELQRNPVGETAELAALYESRGLSPELAAQVAEVISRDPTTALGVHAREELHVDPEALPSPWAAAGLSFVSFVTGAVVPLVPYLMGFSSIVAAFVLSAVALVVGGGVVGRMTARPVGLAAARQLLVGAISAGATFGIGALIGVDAAG
jgi:VIT1/CCC1 family predicted Fe2+/Mn2+ transporter